MTDRETFRLAPPVVFWWIWVAFVVANAADYTVQGIGSAHFVALVSSILLLATGLAYTLALRPRVYADPTGLTAINPYRTHFVPWRLITAVDTSEYVRIHWTRPTPTMTTTPSAGEACGSAAVSGAGEACGSAAVPGAGEACGSGAPQAGVRQAVAPRGCAAASGLSASSASNATLYCWALYVSPRAQRKIAAPPPVPRAAPRSLLGLVSSTWNASSAPSRLPEEARYLASLPPAKAIAIRLDRQADRERARTPDNSNTPPQPAAHWSWPALAAVLIPTLILIATAIT